MSQTILDALADVEAASQDQSAASQALSADFAGTIDEIDTKVNQAVQRTDDAISRVDAAIPTAVNDELNQTLYLDVVNGDDETATGLGSSPYKTLKALIDSAPIGACICVRGNNGQVIDIDENITLVNKHVALFLQDTTYNFRANIFPVCSSIKFSYTSTYNQFVEMVFQPTSSIIFMGGGTIIPSESAKFLIKPNYNGSSVTQPGGLYNQINLSALTVPDVASSYDLISPSYYKSLMAVVTYQLTLGTNVNLFNSLYEVIQFGAKGSYMIGS